MTRREDGLLSCPAPLSHRDIVQLAQGGGDLGRDRPVAREQPRAISRFAMHVERDPRRNLAHLFHRHTQPAQRRRRLRAEGDAAVRAPGQAEVLRRIARDGRARTSFLTSP